MNLLFVCSENRLRSPTAEAIFSDYEGVRAIGAGTNKDAPTPVSGDLIQWADAVLVMEQSHRRKVSKKFGALLGDKPLVCLDVPDRFAYMEQGLVRLLEARVSRLLNLS